MKFMLPSEPGNGDRWWEEDNKFQLEIILQEEGSVFELDLL